MSWRDTQRFMKIASAVRGVGWIVSAICLGLGAFSVFELEGDEALSVIRVVAITLVLLIGVSHVVAWLIEKHAERVVVR